MFVTCTNLDINIYRTCDGKGNKNYTVRLSIIFPSAAPWLIFGTTFQSSQHTADVVLLKLCNDSVTAITQIQNFPQVTKGGERDFTII